MIMVGIHQCGDCGFLTKDLEKFERHNCKPLPCQHRPEWIKQRPDKSFYCTVCRAMIWEQERLF